MYGTQFVFEPKATFFMCCNDVPSPESCDGGITRRIRIIPLGQKFVANPNPAKIYEQRIDEELDRKIDGWGSAFIFILYFYRIQYPHAQIRECDDVIEYTDEIARETDHFHRFAAENLLALTPEEEIAGRFTTLETIWGMYETFCGVHKLKKTPKHSLKRRLHERYGTLVVDRVYVIQDVSCFSFHLWTAN